MTYHPRIGPAVNCVLLLPQRLCKSRLLRPAGATSAVVSFSSPADLHGRMLVFIIEENLLTIIYSMFTTRHSTAHSKGSELRPAMLLEGHKYILASLQCRERRCWNEVTKTNMWVPTALTV